MNHKFIDAANIILFVSTIAIIGDRFLPGLLSRQVISSDLTGSEFQTPDNWGRNREFPPYFSDDQKLLITEQKHDYERTTKEDESVYQKYLDLVKNMPERVSKISVFRYKNDCFADPSIVRVVYGSKLIFQNTGTESINLGLGKGNWDIEAGEQIEVIPEFDNIKKGDNLQGYSCSPFGLAGYLVLESK